MLVKIIAIRDTKQVINNILQDAVIIRFIFENKYRSKIVIKKQGISKEVIQKAINEYVNAFKELI